MTNTTQTQSRRLISFFLVLALAFTLLPLGALKASAEENPEIADMETVNTETADISGSGYSYQSFLKMLSIYTNEGSTAWRGDSGIDKNEVKIVLVSGGVTEIGNEAFSCCTGIGHVSLPAGLAVIGQEAFFKCSSLESITLPDTLRTIEQGAFDFSGLNGTLVIPEGITEIGTQAFARIPVTGIQLPDTLRTIGKNGFAGCYKLRSMTIPAGVTNIEESAFSAMRQLETLILRSNTPCTIGEEAFSYGNSTYKILVPAGSEISYRSAETGNGWQQYAEHICEA